MKINRIDAMSRVVVGSSLVIGILLFPGPGSGQDAGPDGPPENPPIIVPPPQGTAGRLHAAPPVVPAPEQPAKGRRSNALRGGSQGDHQGDRRKPPAGQSAVDQHSGIRPSQLFQERFDLRVIPWGDGSGVPISGNKLVIVGIDDQGLLHIRIFDAGGKSVMDTNETKLSDAQVVAILTLKRQLQGLSAPQVLTGGEKARVIRKVTSIVAQTPQDPQRRLRQAQPRELSRSSRAIRSRSGRDAGSSPNPGRTKAKDAGR